MDELIEGDLSDEDAAALCDRLRDHVLEHIVASIGHCATWLALEPEYRVECLLDAAYAFASSIHMREGDSPRKAYNKLIAYTDYIKNGLDHAIAVVDSEKATKQ